MNETLHDPPKGAEFLCITGRRACEQLSGIPPESNAAAPGAIPELRKPRAVPSRLDVSGHTARGTWIVKVDPCPGALSKDSRPPVSSARRREIASPIPAPPMVPFS